MQPRLMKRKRALSAYCGIETDEQGNPLRNPKPMPMNLTKRGADVLVAHMAANPPSHEFVSKRLQFRGRALALSMASDNLNSEINRVQTTRMGLLNALLSERSVFKIGVRSGAEMVKLNGKLYDPGQPYCVLIDNDDHGFDWTAREREAMTWERNKYRVSLQIVKDCGLFNPAEVAKLRPIGSKSNSDHYSVNSHEIGGDHEEDAFLEDMVELMDVFFYMPDGSTWLCTCSGTPEENSDWLRVQEWSGPERGPYEWLEFYPVPNNIMAVSWHAAQAVQELLANQVLQKLVKSVMRAKKGVGFRGQVDQKEVDAVEQGDDGFVAKFSDATEITPMELGGAVADAWKLLGPLMESWNFQSGNVNVLGGTDAQSGSDTLGEYQGMAANAGVVMGHIQRIEHEHEERKSRQLAFYLQNDPARKYFMPHRIPGGEWLEVVYDPDTVEDDHSDYEYKIRQSSMVATSPAQLLNNLTQFYTIFLPTGALNVVEAGRTWMDQAGIDNADAILPDQERDMEMQMAMAGVPGPTQGQITGPSQTNPRAFGSGGYGQQPQQPAQIPAQGGMQPMGAPGGAPMGGRMGAPRGGMGRPAMQPNLNGVAH